MPSEQGFRDRVVRSLSARGASFRLVRGHSVDSQGHGQSWIRRSPPCVTAYIHGPACRPTVIRSIAGRCFSRIARLSAVDWLRRAGEHEATDTVGDPHALLDRPVADLLVTSDHDEAASTDDFEPPIVGRLPRHLREVLVAREHHAGPNAGERLGQRKIGLVDEEPGGHRPGLRRQRSELLLVGDRRSHPVLRKFVRPGDLSEGLTGIGQLPQPLRAHTVDRWATEPDQRIDHHR